MRSKQVKFIADARTARTLHVRSLREGRCKAELIRMAGEKFLAIDPETEPSADVETFEFGEGKPSVTAVYLSHRIPAAVHRLAKERRRSKSFVVCELLRRALRDELLLSGAVAEVAEPSPTETSALPTD
jgi:hypothetical protein